VNDIIRRRGSTLTPGIKKVVRSNSIDNDIFCNRTSSTTLESLLQNNNSNNMNVNSTQQPKIRLAGGGSLVHLDLYRNALPKRHKKETLEQYIHRTSLITGRHESDVTAELNFIEDDNIENETDKEKTCNHKKLSEFSQVHPYHLLPRNLHIKNTQPIIESSMISLITAKTSKKKKISPAVTSIAKYRRKKITLQKKIEQNSTILANYRRIYSAAVLIQSVVRGFIVRNNIDIIVTSLLYRKEHNRINTDCFNYSPLSVSTNNSRKNKLTNIQEEDNSNQLSDNENILNQSDKQFFAEDLDNNDNLIINEKCDVKGNNESVMLRVASEGYLLNGLLPVRARDKINPFSIRSVSLSPPTNNIFKRYRFNRSGDKVLSSSTTTLSQSTIVPGISRRHSDGVVSNLRLDSSEDIRKKKLAEVLSTTTGISAFEENRRNESGKLTSMDDDDIPYERLLNSKSTSFDEKNSHRSSSPVVFDESGKIFSIFLNISLAFSFQFIYFFNLMNLYYIFIVLNEHGVPLPVYSLGPRAGDILSRREQQFIVNMWQLLRTGIIVLKHGRSGRPKRRTLYCDDNLQVLYYADDKEDGNHSSSHVNVTHSKPRRSSFSVFSRSDSRREVVLKDVLEVFYALRDYFRIVDRVLNIYFYATIDSITKLLLSYLIIICYCILHR
jgi:hypothetical protein